MIGIDISREWLVLLRALLLLLPLALTLYLGWKRRENDRMLVGALFSFVYSLGVLLPAHALAIHFGFWSYGGDAIKLLGMPADLWFGGSFLFGPVVFLAFPRLSPWVFTALFVALQGVMFRSLDPFVIAGEWWFMGVVAVFLVAHIPALYFAQWTAERTALPRRAALMAFGYGFLAFVVLPTLIMHAMGGEWNLQDKPLWAFAATAAALAPFMIIGLHAVQMFAVHGEGTPIPLDCTQRLVASGLYAYVRNSMQLASAASWLIIGIFLQNFWVSLAAGMAVIFVLGMVRWHHRNDLEVRFPKGWTEYRESVPEWRPLWRPWMAHRSAFSCPASAPQYAAWLAKRAVALDMAEGPLAYQDGNSGIVISGASAWLYPLFHVNFATAFAAAAALLALVPFNCKNRPHQV